MNGTQFTILQTLLTGQENLLKTLAAELVQIQANQIKHHAQLVTGLAQLAAIESSGLGKILNMLDAAKLGQLFTLLTQLLATLPNDATTIASLQGQIATLTANDAALDALSPQLDGLIAGVTAATPPVVPAAAPAPDAPPAAV